MLHGRFNSESFLQALCHTVRTFTLLVHSQPYEDIVGIGFARCGGKLTHDRDEYKR